MVVCTYRHGSEWQISNRECPFERIFEIKGVGVDMQWRQLFNSQAAQGFVVVEVVSHLDECLND